MHLRLLIVSPTPFLPGDAGNRVRIKNVVASLQQLGVAVHFLHVEREKGDRDAMLRSLGEKHFRAISYSKPDRSEPIWRRGIRHVQQILNPELRHVSDIDDWYDPAITREVLDWHREVNFSAIMVEYVFFSALFDHLPPSITKILDTHDRFSMRHRVYLQRGIPPRFFSTTREGEARGLRRADLILAIQQQEKEFFSQLTERPVETLGHLVTVENCHVEGSRTGPLRLIIVGSDNEINVDGLLQFLHEDWPAIRELTPSCQLLVAGHLGNSVPYSFSSSTDITALGYIPDIAEAYRRADIAINPVRGGTGLNIKSVEALGYGVPLISTTSGCRGLESAIDDCILKADHPHEFALAVARIGNDHKLADAMSSSATSFARRWNSRSLDALVSALRPASHDKTRHRPSNKSN